MRAILAILGLALSCSDFAGPGAVSLSPLGRSRGASVCGGVSAYSPASFCVLSGLRVAVNLDPGFPAPSLPGGT